MSIDDVLKCLQDDNVASQAWVERLQDATYNTDKQKYNQNYKYCQSCYDEGGFDGILGRNTRADIVHFLQDNPEALLDIGENLTQHLYDHGYGKALENVASSDTSLQDNLRAEIDCILDGRALSELDRDELKDVQTNWKLLGEYDGKIDGIIGKKSRKAFAGHTRAGCQPEAAPAPVDYAPLPQPSNNVYHPSLPENFNAQASRLGRNGDYGISLNHIENAQKAAAKGQTYKGFKPQAGQKVVVIDLGHNSEHYSKKSKRRLNDKGAHSKYTNQSETDFVDPVAIDLAEKYHQQGYLVAFTRNPDEKINMHYDRSLNYRARIAAGLGADIFISLHANGSRDKSASYGAVYCQSGRATQNDKNFAHSVAQNMDIHGNGTPARKLTKDLGVLRKFRQLGKNDAVCVLLEPGFLSNEKDAKALETISKNPDNFTNGIVGATVDYAANLGVNHNTSLAYAQTNRPQASYQ